MPSAERIAPPTTTSEYTVAQDFCALSQVRRLAALLDRDPWTIQDGDRLPHGWHVILFNTPTPQSRLGRDGSAGLGVVLPDLGLRRLMLGGRQTNYLRTIPIGTAVQRHSRLASVRSKHGRSGLFTAVTIEHRIHLAGDDSPALIETVDYLLRDVQDAPSRITAPVSQDAPHVPAGNPPVSMRELVADEALLFRFSAITDNPHRIHYDKPYATQQEGYPALVVNGSIPAMFLMEMFREVTGREPTTWVSRNLAPIFCGRPMRLSVQGSGSEYRLLAHDDQGQLCLNAHAG